ALVGLDAGDGRTLGLERAPARRDHDRLDLEHLAAIGGDAEQRIADLLDLLDHALEVERRAERLHLPHGRVAESLASNGRNAGKVVDGLLRIELRALAADLVEDIDDMRFHIEQPELEHREQPAWPRAHDEDISLDQLAHGFIASRLAGLPRSRRAGGCTGTRG